jgi:hypothetical protein
MKKILTIIILFFALNSEAQTIFYMEASGAQNSAAGVFSDWTVSNSAILRRSYATGYKQATTIASTTITVDFSSGSATTCFGQFVSPYLEAQTISGTITGYARMNVSNVTGCTAQSRVKVTVINMAGTVVATLVALTAGASNLTTTLTSYQILNAAAISSYACARGDRICIEVGIGRSLGTTSRTGTISFGSSSATNITAAGSTTANNPVLTFSGNISFYKGATF